MAFAIRKLKRIRTGQMGVVYLDSETGEELPFPLPEGYEVVGVNGEVETPEETEVVEEQIAQGEVDGGGTGGSSGNGFSQTGVNPFKSNPFKGVVKGVRSLFGDNTAFNNASVPQKDIDKHIATKGNNSPFNPDDYTSTSTSENTWDKAWNPYEKAELADPYEEMVSTTTQSEIINGINYKNKGRQTTRNLDLSTKLSNMIKQTAADATATLNGNFEWSVTSGGQPKKGTSSDRVGTTSHDLGNGTDGYWEQDGKRLEFDNKADRKTLSKVLSLSAKNGINNFGQGNRYQNGKLHMALKGNTNAVAYGNKRLNPLGADKYHDMDPDLVAAIKQGEKSIDRSKDWAVKNIGSATTNTNIDPLGAEQIVREAGYDPSTMTAEDLQVQARLVHEQSTHEQDTRETNRQNWLAANSGPFGARGLGNPMYKTPRDDFSQPEGGSGGFGPFDPDVKPSAAQAVIDAAPVSKEIVDVILGEAKAGSYKDMVAIAGVVSNRSDGTGASWSDIVSNPNEFNAFGKPLPKGVDDYRTMAERAIRDVKANGSKHDSTFYSTKKTMGNLPSGLVQRFDTGPGGHVYQTDPQQRAIGTSKGYKSMDYSSFGNNMTTTEDNSRQPQNSNSQNYSRYSQYRDAGLQDAPTSNGYDYTPTLGDTDPIYASGNNVDWGYTPPSDPFGNTSSYQSPNNNPSSSYGNVEAGGGFGAPYTSPNSGNNSNPGYSSSWEDTSDGNNQENQTGSNSGSGSSSSTYGGGGRDSGSPSGGGGNNAPSVPMQNSGSTSNYGNSNAGNTTTTTTQAAATGNTGGYSKSSTGGGGWSSWW